MLMLLPSSQLLQTPSPLHFNSDAAIPSLRKTVKERNQNFSGVITAALLTCCVIAVTSAIFDLLRRRSTP